MLFRLARRLLDGDAARAEDAVQESWVRAVERIGEYRGDSAFRTWLAGFVVRIAREQLRPARLERDLDADPGADDVRLTGTFARVDLERAIAALAPGFREVLWMHDVEGFTHEEIAQALGIVPGTSKSQLARARQAMRRALTAGG
jgi:RNA polymerase sigma-70 factor (ECF subfamily)